MTPTYRFRKFRLVREGLFIREMEAWMGPHIAARLWSRLAFTGQLILVIVCVAVSARMASFGCFILLL
jgi:hypothetical protein